MYHGLRCFIGVWMVRDIEIGGTTVDSTIFTTTLNTTITAVIVLEHRECDRRNDRRCIAKTSTISRDGTTLNFLIAIQRK